jgi:hypothetical protein
MQIDTHRHKHTQRQICRYINTHRHTERDIDTDIHRNTPALKHRHTYIPYTYIDTSTHIESQNEMRYKKYIDTNVETQMYTDTHRYTDVQRYIYIYTQAHIYAAHIRKQKLAYIHTETHIHKQLFKCTEMHRYSTHKPILRHIHADI